LLFALLFIALLWFALALTIVFELGGLVLLALFALAGIYVAIKFVFVLQALAFGGQKATVKKALEKSWLFCEGKFFSVLALVIALAIIYSVLLWAGGLVSGMVAEETAALVVFAVFWGIFLAFSGLALAAYYAEKGLGKSI
jgi:hypothetical protein